MYDSHGPDRLPRNMLVIVVAVAISCLGYLFFTIRFGEPMRSAEEAIQQYRQAEQQLPDRIDKAIERRFGLALQTVQADVDDLRRRSAAGPANPLDARVKTLEARVRELTTSLDRAEKQLAAASLNAANAARLASAIQQSLAAGSAPAVVAVPEASLPAGQPIPVILATPEQSPEIPDPLDGYEPALVDRRGEFVCVVTSQRITSQGIVVEFTLTNEGADQGVLVHGPYDHRSNGHATRIVTSTGLIIRSGSVARGNEKWYGRILQSDLPKDVPIAFRVLFSGEFTEAVRCPRLEIEIARANKNREKIVFRFENVTIEPE